MTDTLRQRHPVSAYDDIRELKMQSPYVSFFYADDGKRSFVPDAIHRCGVPFRETENGLRRSNVISVQHHSPFMLINDYCLI